MTREFEPDPEVLADLELREQTARERPRSEARVNAVYAWTKPEFVGAWRCRMCRSKLVPITADDLEYAAMWNRELRRRGEKPMDPDQIMFCDECRDKHRDIQIGRNRERGERMRVEIIKLKQSENPEHETLTIRNLRELGHPDVDGLVQSLQAKTKARAEKARGKAKL